VVVKSLTGNYAVAWAVKLAKVKVIAAYPITPQTTIVERLSEFVERGLLDAKMIRVDSEFSALAATWGAAAGGVRAFTATSSHGLLYMHEVVWWVAGSRIPLVMAIVTRTIGPPWNIWTDHSDIMDQRDTGWIIMMAEHNQEVLDSVIQLYRITEDPRVYLPGMIGLDAFILSHTTEPVDIPSQELVDSYLPPRRQPYIMTIKEPLIMGNIPSDLKWNMKMRWDVHVSLIRAKEVIEEADREWYKLTGRSYGGLIECYKCDDAKLYIIGMGAWVGDMRDAVDRLRDEGYDIGLIKVRFIRPFPDDRIASVVRNAKLCIVFDRSVSAGSAGPLFLDVTAHMHRYGINVPVVNVLAGLTGLDITSSEISYVVKKIYDSFEKGELRNNIVWYFGGDELWW